MRTWGVGKGWKKRVSGLVLALGAGLLLAGNPAGAKSKEVRIDLGGLPVRMERPKAVDRAERVTVRCSRKSVVRAEYRKDRKDRRIVLAGRKKGNATVTVRCAMRDRTVKTCRYKVKVFVGRKVTAKDRGKKAFRIQNRYRKEKGVAPLEWSDELYGFCLYRLKTSGFDGHKNLGRDENGYFGKFARFRHLLLAENLYCGSGDAASAMEAWEKSPGHRRNLLSASHVCGAVACHNSAWCAIFYDGDRGGLAGWKDCRLKEVTVRRHDRQKGIYLKGSAIGYYEAGKRRDTLEAAVIAGASGRRICLETGKTYVFYERRPPDGVEKAEKVTVTVTEDGADEIILES